MKWMKKYILRFYFFFPQKQQDTQSWETDNEIKYFQKCKSWLTGSHVSKKMQKNVLKFQWSVFQPLLFFKITCKKKKKVYLSLLSSLQSRQQLEIQNTRLLRPKVHLAKQSVSQSRAAKGKSLGKRLEIKQKHKCHTRKYVSKQDPSKPISL